jgi:ppGpp synthetase/RelA/SpoT-type nucleotidyltranferase
MDNEKLPYYALHLQTCGDRAIPDVLQMLRDAKLADLCYAYKIRTKPEEKLIEKVGRKSSEKPQYTLSDITDVVGLRLVALFRSEMVEIFDKVLAAITHKNGINPNPFYKADPEEVIVYTGANAFDDLVPRLKDVAKRHCPAISLNEKKSSEGYSSVHIVTRLNAKPGKVPCAGYMLPIEIQIRSVFEDAWGEIDHKFGYVIRSGKDIGKPINNPEFVLSHLKVLKRFSDACMEYADAIQSEAIGLPSSLGAVSTLTAGRKVVSVQSDAHVIQRFKQLEVKGECIDRYENARRVKEEAGALLDRDPAEGKSRYVSAAELFREVADDLQTDMVGDPHAQGARLAYYYSRMNEAICLLSTNERDQVIAAHRIYQGLDPQFSEFPLLKMRYGQALGKLGRIEDAIEKLREAGESADRIARSAIAKSTDQWPDEMPFADYEHISTSQPKLLGYHLWLKIRSLDKGAREERLALFSEAYNVTEASLRACKDDKKLELSLHNNLLYYALGKRFAMADVGETDIIAKTDAAIKEHLDYIEGSCSSVDNLPVSQLDTLMKAYVLQKRDADAKSVARKMLDKCLSEPNVELQPKDALEFVQLAFKVMEGREVASMDL